MASSTQDSSIERREIERVMFWSPVAIPSSSLRALAQVESKPARNLQGGLQLHGNSQSMRLETQVMVGEETLKAQGSFSVRQPDYGLKIASIAGGSLTLKGRVEVYLFHFCTPPATRCQGAVSSL
jgi:hypothetical protein